VVRLENAAVATSGDYRNFIEYNGTRISHTFDGRTGAPVTHHLASVTVIQPTTLQADGFATLLEVLGPVAGPEFANSTGLAALFIERTEHGFVTNATADMAAYLERETK
jgi:thiamine biosynthesis lipoprotein